MKINVNKIQPLIDQIDLILETIKQSEIDNASKIREAHPSFKKSVLNLVNYRAMRTIDITSLQKKLRYLGLSRIARAEAHVLASLQHCKFILNALLGKHSTHQVKPNLSIKKSHKLLTSNTRNLLGHRSRGRRVRIMVTMPIEAANNYKMVHKMLELGMNTARINCAHDGPEDWKKMIENIARAKKKLNKNCKISMDLAGPKIRTGNIEPGPQVVRFRPERNEFGEVISPATIRFVSELTENENGEIPVDSAWIDHLEVDDQVAFTDARGKHRDGVVKGIENGCAFVHCLDTSYIETGTILRSSKSLSCMVQELPAIERAILLKVGDRLRIVKGQVLGQPIAYDEEGQPNGEAVISCTSPQIFDFVLEGERVLFDDGKISGIIRQVKEDELEVEITQTKHNGAQLKADKGINLPDTTLKLSGLTEKDREDLKFIIKYADIVNFSFVNSVEDVKELYDELTKLDAPSTLGVILKIETQDAFNNLTDLLLEGMKNYPLGVMIARGDLAVESGWENMARIQQEILSICNAAHVPIVWATQVLETLAKKGIPSRSEITDAATALNAECVMLNKGPYIQRALILLNYILKSQNEYRDKNLKMTPIMETASNKGISSK